MSAPRPVSVFHLLVADEALRPGRWGVHLAVCGLEVRSPNATVVEHECGLSCDCVRYCPECVREAARWNAEAGQVAR